jgi:sec-independent protein translocase protein TatB
MFDFGVGYSEMFVLALIAIIVIGPKDLPKVLRAFGRTMAKVRAMAHEFQGHVDVAMKEAGLEDVKKDLQALKVGNPLATLRSDIESATSAPKVGGAAAKAPAAKPKNDFDTYFDAPAAPKKQDEKASS